VKRTPLPFVFALLWLVGCGGHPVGPMPYVGAPSMQTVAGSPMSTVAGASALDEGAATAPKVYWTLFNSLPNPQVQYASTPLKTTSKITTVNGNAQNQLVCANAIRYYKSQLWIVNLNPCNGSGSSIVRVFKLPLTSKSKPQKTFLLTGPLDADHMAFDASGDLWVPSFGNNSVYEYTGPFTSSGTLTPAITLTVGFHTPQGLGFDSHGNLYVANTDTNGKQAVAVFKAPIANHKPYYLQGVISPSGLAFDRHGNLFVSSNAPTAAIAEYASGALKPGAKPSVVDSTGIMPNAYGADLKFDAKGNLYDGDCGKTAGVYSYPTAAKPFSKTLAPAFYTNSTLQSVGCVWGVAIH
jgi:hypothetical protein